MAAGRWAQAATILSVILTTFLTLVANQLLLRQLLRPLASLVAGRALSSVEAVVVSCSAVALVVPLTFLPTLNSLRHVGLLSVIAIMGLVIVISIKSASCVPSAESAPHPFHLVASPWSVLMAMPVFVCTYLCSFSALPIDIELRAPSRRRMNLYLQLAFGASLIMCVAIACSGRQPPSPIHLYLQLAWIPSLIACVTIASKESPPPPRKRQVPRDRLG